ncbi:hypothetical protein [Flavobacterium sp.]|uniref:hypothetical protein n=1 Tax=Flavobacterium sp. TaxID=239 RepID=UPI003340A07D
MKKSAIISVMFTMMMVLTSFSTPSGIGGTRGTGGGGKNPTDGTLSVGGENNTTIGTLSVGGTGGGGKNPKGTI